MRTSRVLVTIVDPYTFESEWVVKENAWAEQYGRPIITLYDGDTPTPIYHIPTLTHAALCSCPWSGDPYLHPHPHLCATITQGTAIDGSSSRSGCRCTRMSSAGRRAMHPCTRCLIARCIARLLHYICEYVAHSR